MIAGLPQADKSLFHKPDLLTLLTLIIGYRQHLRVVGSSMERTLKEGDLVVQTAGTLTGISGSTDLIKVGLVRKIVSRGISIGEIGVTGKARNIKTYDDLSFICPGEILFVPRELLEKIPLSKSIAGIVTNENVDECYRIFNTNKKKYSTICNLETLDNLVMDGDLITLQLNEGVVYMGQIKDDEDALDKYKYV